MLIVTAHNITGTKPDGTSDYDIEARVNERVIAKFQVKGHVREAGAAPLLRLMADQLERQDRTTDRVKGKDLLTRYRRCLEGLTPGGSEFIDDPERCAETVTSHRDSLMRALVNNVKRIKELEAKLT